MKLLLDTHILLWTLTNDKKLSEKARKLIENEANEIYYSTLSLWEVELKHLAHPDMLPLTASELMNYCGQSGFKPQPLLDRHILGLSALKRQASAPAHKEPFDRVLICQASAENMLFLTHDASIAGYEEACILYV